MDVFGLIVLTMFVLWLLLDDSFQVPLVFGYIGHLALPAAFIWLPLAIVRRRSELDRHRGGEHRCVRLAVWRAISFAPTLILRRTARPRSP